MTDQNLNARFLLALHKSDNSLMSHFLSVPIIQGHGMLVEPPARNSMWRYGFDNPSNNDDNGLFCGGRYVSIFRFISNVFLSFVALLRVINFIHSFSSEKS